MLSDECTSRDFGGSYVLNLAPNILNDSSNYQSTNKAFVDTLKMLQVLLMICK